MFYRYIILALLAMSLFAGFGLSSCAFNTDKSPDVYTAQDRLDYTHHINLQKSLKEIEEEEIIANTKEVSDGHKKQKK